jgi:hypothetical protein
MKIKLGKVPLAVFTRYYFRLQVMAIECVRSNFTGFDHTYHLEHGYMKIVRVDFQKNYSNVQLLRTLQKQANVHRFKPTNVL